MASLETISDSLLVAEGYYLELIAQEILDLENSLTSKLTKKISCLNRLIRSLTWDVNDDVDDDDTQSIYRLLLIEIAPYSGSSLSFNPNVVIPGSTIIINSENDTMHKTQANLIEDGVDTSNWYLPFLNDSNQSYANGYIPTNIIVNGQTFNGWYFDEWTQRIYGFTDNATKTIEVLVQYSAP